MLQVSKKQDSQSKQQQKQKRKPRFSQQAYKADEASKNRQTTRKFTTQSTSSSSRRRNRKGETTILDNDYEQQNVPTRSSPSSNGTTRRRPVPISPNVPWNSGKSMEELESIMTKRWGTDSSKWSEDDEDYDDDDIEIIEVIDTGNESSNGKQTKDNFFFKSPSSPQDEYYDPDDVGYEPPSSKKSRQQSTQDLNFDNLMSPKPVGGKGTKETTGSNKPSVSFQDHTSEIHDNQGFFFRKQQAAQTPTSQQQSASSSKPIQPPTPAKRERIAKPELRPFVRDENGNPLLLTLEQAQRNFDAMVADNAQAKSSEEQLQDMQDDSTSSSWEALGITSPILLRNLQQMQCATPLAVQDKACPSIITGNDVLVGTYTGSGKTLAFLVPLIERILFSTSAQQQPSSLSSSLRILVVVPGRELASQVVSVARDLLEGTGLTTMLAIGGTGFGRNLQNIRQKKPTILVGTPGRIAELVVGRPGEKSGRLKIQDLQSLVLDEFDALLEYKPHRDPTAAIVGALKRRHGDALQSVLCSATATDMLGKSKLDQFLRPGFAQAMADENDILVTSPATATDSESQTKERMATRVSRTVMHGVVHVPHRRFALEALRRILHTEPIPQQILIFAEDARKVNIIVEKLETMGIIAAPLCGGSNSEKVDRAEVAKALREGYVGIVVATEMAARGLDAPLLTHVINLHLPTDASHYAHRSGRVGRGGRPGVVINLTTSPQERNVPQKFANQLGVEMHAVEARAGKLHIVEGEATTEEA